MCDGYVCIFDFHPQVEKETLSYNSAVCATSSGGEGLAKKVWGERAMVIVIRVRCGKVVD